MVGKARTGGLVLPAGCRCPARPRCLCLDHLDGLLGPAESVFAQASAVKSDERGQVFNSPCVSLLVASARSPRASGSGSSRPAESRSTVVLERCSSLGRTGTPRDFNSGTRMQDAGGCSRRARRGPGPMACGTSARPSSKGCMATSALTTCFMCSTSSTRRMHRLGPACHAGLQAASKFRNRVRGRVRARLNPFHNPLTLT